MRFASFRVLLIAAASLLVMLLAGPFARNASAQRTAMSPPTASLDHRTRLILKDGTYQVVLSYKVSGSVVKYKSAERNGETEEVPLALVDIPATQQWERDHHPAAGDAASQQTSVLSPELAREEASRAARTPEVALNLKLPDDDSVVVLDTFQDTPEIVPLSQHGGDLNKQTAHNVLRTEINPASSAHQILLVPGEQADVQLHVAEPVFFVRLASKDDENDEIAGGAFTVDTSHAAGRATPVGGSPASTYVLLHVDVRIGARAVDSFHLYMLGGPERQADVVELAAQTLPGGRWLRLKPQQPLEIGEYVLMEVLDGNAVNLGVWDFGVHPTAPENADALLPVAPRKPELDRRRPQ